MFSNNLTITINYRFVDPFAQSAVYHSRDNTFFHCDVTDR